MFADEGVKLEEAVTLIRKAVEMEPENGAFIDSLGWAYFKLGRLDEALAELLRAVSTPGARMPRSANTWATCISARACSRMLARVERASPRRRERNSSQKLDDLRKRTSRDGQ